MMDTLSQISSSNAQGGLNGYQSMRREKNMVVAKKGRRRTLMIAGAVSSAVAVTAVFAQSECNNSAPTRKRYLPEYTASGDLILPKNFNEWVFVGSPLAPNALNGGKANSPEFHNVYIEPGSYEMYKTTGEFPEETIFFKELQLTFLAEHPDGSRTEASGRGFFPGKLNGADVTVKNSKRYAGTGGWGYYNFNHHEAKAPTAKVRMRVLSHDER
ncbi:MULTISPECIES: cytochrome P460 family protein [unclassified Bradyrhizobium]|uniref:cytochrome P460 family protein n=1 Tax=unclassified Bradyrhizobium TaxID=2631580 RepID=UPI001FE13F68|nr:MULTISPECIES: cytochrome P460 family protein [unclassified Bradyrhizobium]